MWMIPLKLQKTHLLKFKPAERRQYARWPCTITTHDKTLIQCRSLDVSERGISIYCPVNFKMNVMFVFELNVRYKGLHKKLRILSKVKRTSI